MKGAGKREDGHRFFAEVSKLELGKCSSSLHFRITKNQSLGKNICATVSCVTVFQFLPIQEKGGKAENLQSFLHIGKREFFVCLFQAHA